MCSRRLAGATLALCLLAGNPAFAADDAALFRLFLKDGTSLVSYGEFARVGDRVVFSMPTAATPNPPVHLMELAADRVDWDRTNRYAATVRETHYIETQAEQDYAVLSNSVTQTLNELALSTDAAKRLAIVERARTALAEWPSNHFNYRANEIRQMLGMLDEAIADLRASSRTGRFDLAITAFSVPAGPPEPLLPRPTPRDAIEQTLLAAGLADSAAERSSLLKDALTSLDAAADSLPADWVTSVRSDTLAKLEVEQRFDRQYAAFTNYYISVAHQRAGVANVRGVEQLIARIQTRDAVLGRHRPESVNALIAAVQGELDAARRLRLARDRWSLRLPEFRKYYASMATPLAQLARLRPPLESIKALAGSTPGALDAIQTAVTVIVTTASGIDPPEEFRTAHAQLVSAAHLAGNAANIRRQATLAGDMARAWDASSAAAGALMLGRSARQEIVRLLNPPRLQ
jgi:hypothetical protein